MLEGSFVFQEWSLKHLVVEAVGLDFYPYSQVFEILSNIELIL